MIPSATAAGSASSKTITGALPPSSRWTRFSVSAAALAISLPVPTSPVSDTMRTSGWRTRPAPTGSPSPVITLKTPGGKDLARVVGEHQRRDRRLLRGLENRGVPGGERGADLPDAHHERVVPRRDLADDANRLAAEHRRVPRDDTRRPHGPRDSALRPQRSAGCPRTPESRPGRRTSGLPTFCDSSGQAPPRAPRPRRRAARACLAISPGVESRQPTIAFFAASTARSTSACVPLGTSAITSPVAGFRTSMVSPSTASTASPPTKFSYRATLTLMPLPPFLHRGQTSPCDTRQQA